MESVHTGEKSLAEAIGEHEADMRPHESQDVQLTLEQAHAAHYSEALMQFPVFKLGANKPKTRK